jgi:phosphopantetheinyl transferase (holo-ACP synthase)
MTEQSIRQEIVEIPLASRDRRAASLAGLSAARQALAVFFSPLLACGPDDFAVAHDPAGKPHLSAWPADLDRLGYRPEWCDLSISHSRRSACALVAGLDPSRLRGRP